VSDIATSRTPSSFDAISAGLLALFAGVLATFYVFTYDLPLGLGDAAAHLNIARRLVDTRSPGLLQFGTVWLPFAHAVMAPFAAIDSLWVSGLAGALINVPCLGLAASAIFLIAADLSGTRLCAWTAAACFTANPNLLYLAATPMTEVLSLALLLWTTHLCLRTSQSRCPAALAGLVAALACLTRYEAWFLLPFLVLLLLARRGLFAAITFGVIAALGPLAWLTHNWWFFGDPLEFYRGEWSATAIYARSLAAGVPPYPPEASLPTAAHYFSRTVWLTCGAVVSLAGLAGWLRSLRSWAALIPLAAPVLFYTWSLHSAGTQIYIPGLWPDTLYNARYGLVALPLLAVGGGLLMKGLSWRWSALLVAASLAIWGFETALVRDEAHRNSVERRRWTDETARFLQANYRGGGIAVSFGDLTAALQQAAIPLRETLHDGDRLRWLATLARPDALLDREWVLCIKSDPLSLATARSGKYDRVAAGTNASPVEIWKWRLRPIEGGKLGSKEQ
jgi:hypothetical protein